MRFWSFGFTTWQGSENVCFFGRWFSRASRSGVTFMGSSNNHAPTSGDRLSDQYQQASIHRALLKTVQSDFKDTFSYGGLEYWSCSVNLDRKLVSSSSSKMFTNPRKWTTRERLARFRLFRTVFKFVYTFVSASNRLHCHLSVRVDTPKLDQQKVVKNSRKCVQIP